MSTTLRNDLRDRLAALDDPPLISVLMAVKGIPADRLGQTIESVRAQVYEHWELCIVDDASTEPDGRKLLDGYGQRDPRIKSVHRDTTGGVAHATNAAFELASGSWIVALESGDRLASNALAEVAQVVSRHPETELIYSDEDEIDRFGNRQRPHFKPDFSRELFRSRNYLDHLTAHRARNIRTVGGWRPGFDGAQGYDLNLRVLEHIDMACIHHIPKILYHRLATGGVDTTVEHGASSAWVAGMRALEEHVARMDLSATVEPAPGTAFYRLHFAVPEPPLVSLIVPTRDRADLLRRCIESIYSRSTYENYELIVVDNASSADDARRYLDQIAQRPNARVLSYTDPFNYSAINNFAVNQARGSIMGLVNNDIEVISPDWLTEMVSWAMQPDVGCVGAKLYFPDDTIQHGGVILGLGGVAGHAHRGSPRDQPGYFYRLRLVHNLSAVTGACMLVRKSVYEQLGGLKEEELPVAFNDIDFCLRVRAAGYQVVWTPYAELYHAESVSRGRPWSSGDVPVSPERLYMQRQWVEIIQNDPCYSPHLTRRREDFSLEGI